MSRSTRTVVIVAVALAVGAGAALGAYPDSDVPHYAACLGPGGTLAQVGPGESPAKPCGPNDTLVHLSAGDITNVIAGTGLKGGGDHGAVTLELDAAHSLPQTCGDGQVPKSDGANGWSCPAGQITWTGVIGLNSFAPWTLNLHCTSHTGTDHVQNIEISAVRMDNVHEQ